MNILDDSAARACTSCQMCGAVCAKGAITIHLDKEGFYRPFVDNTLCVDCGLCIKVCYKFDKEILPTDEAELKRTHLYAASAKDDEIEHKTTSGGVGDLLAKQLISEGYKVIGVTYESAQNRAIHKIAVTRDGTNQFRGSKYIQSYSVEAFCELVKSVRTGKYAIFGLPCQIYSISRYLEIIKKRDNCILIDLYCHGCPSMHVWTKVSDDLKSLLSTQSFQNVNWRSKNRGWGNFILEVTSAESKRYISKPMNNAFYDLFFSNQVLNESCSDCKLRGTLSYTDIRLGDFWGKEYSKSFRGMSGVSIVTTRGKLLFEKILKDIYVVEKSYLTFLPWQSWANEYKIDKNLRSVLINRLADPVTDLKYSVEPLKSGRSVKSRIILLLKQLLSYCPSGIEYQLRKVIK